MSKFVIRIEGCSSLETYVKNVREKWWPWGHKWTTNINEATHYSWWINAKIAQIMMITVHKTEIVEEEFIVRETMEI